MLFNCTQTPHGAINNVANDTLVIKQQAISNGGTTILDLIVNKC